jgi:hypothetical protein
VEVFLPAFTWGLSKYKEKIVKNLPNNMTMYFSAMKEA